jgi:sporulation protein YlmC with PRC-barrel domain
MGASVRQIHAPRVRKKDRKEGSHVDNTNIDMTTPEGRNLTAKTLIGDDVRNSQGEKLGTVQDFMIDLESGKIAYVVVSHGGVLGVGDKLFAIPWGVFLLDTGDHSLLLDVDQETLQNAEGFDKNNWPNTADPTWRRSIDEHYGVTIERREVL